MSFILIVKTRASTGFLLYRENLPSYPSSCVHRAAWRSSGTSPHLTLPGFPHLPLLGTTWGLSRGAGGAAQDPRHPSLSSERYRATRHTETQV